MAKNGIELTKEHKELIANTDITQDFMALIDSVRFEDNFCANIFNAIKKYLPYDFAGLFFNDSGEYAVSTFNISTPNDNITIDVVEVVRDKFFNEMDKHKQIHDIQCAIVESNITEKSDITYDSFISPTIETFYFAEKFTGGIFIGIARELSHEEELLRDVILSQLELVFKFKYLIHEQQQHALYDPMTGLYNRQEFDNMYEFEFSRARRYIYNFTLAMIDIDYLTKINEEYGKDFGDYVITELANVLKGTFRRTDPIYRYGAEEFIILLPFTPITKAVIPIERLRSAIAKHEYSKGGKKAEVTVSIGLCANYSKFTEPDMMLEGLGQALLRAKDRGRNKIDIFE